MISNLAQTIKKAQEEAELKGIEQGGKRKQIEIAKNMLNYNLPIEIISNTTELSFEEIKRIQNKAHHKQLINESPR